jgi:hypothetical protein
MSPTKHDNARTLATRRTGSLYPMVMGMSAVIACLAVAGLEMSRVAGKANQELREQLEARRMAQAGLEFWQRQYNAGAITDPAATLQQDTSPRSGFSVTATYSSAGAAPNGAAQVTSVGRFGSAVQRLTARYEARPTLYENFRCSLYSDAASVWFTSSSVKANHWSIARQDTYTSLVSTIHLDAMTGNTFTGAPSNLMQRKIDSIPWFSNPPFSNLPSFVSNQSSYPGTYYLSPNANAITIFPRIGNSQLLSNPDFSSDLSGWYCNNQAATVTRITSESHNPPASGQISNRTAVTDSPVQDITNLMVTGGQYQAECYMKPDNASSQYRLQIAAYAQGGPTIYSISSTPISPSAGSWTRVNIPPFTFPSLPSPPSKIELSIVSDGLTGFKFDAFKLYRTDQSTAYTYIDSTVLSDTFNPFSLNNSSPASSGIYIVDCQNKPVQIRNSRIRSTLVFKNCPMVELVRGICWETVGRNYPAMIVDGSVVDKTRLDSSLTNNLRESDLSYNFNPSHTPFGGIADNDFSDIFPCTIGGAILATNTITLGNAAASQGTIRNLTGPILSKNQLLITNTTKDITFPSDMILNPPPGFYPAFTPMRLIPSSIDEAPAPPNQIQTVP